jgi:uncharacterized BrkB/YihY/UPF0761 family membrane protein
MDEPSPTGVPRTVEPAENAGSEELAAPGTPGEARPEQGESPGLQERGKALVARGAQLAAQLEAKRPEHASIEVAFRWILRDREIAGGVLGGGLAYRFFFWALSWSVLTAGGLGFASRSRDVASAAEDAGLADSVADAVAATSQQAESNRWWLLLVGVWLVLWFSWGLLRALWLTHAAAWRITPRSIKNGPRAYAVVLAAPVILVAVSSAAGWVRANADPSAGLVVTLLVSAAFGAGWWWVTWKLPSPDGLPWTAFLPGAILMGAGFTALHVFTVYYLAEKLANSSELYGALGLAATMLFYLFCIGRGVIWAAELNAVVWDVRHPGDRRAGVLVRDREKPAEAEAVGIGEPPPGAR